MRLFSFILCLLVSFEVSSKVYDCFTFFNEYEVLEIRLNELYDYVDKFVIAESCQSFRGLPKSYNFEKEQHRYAKFADKIIYIKTGAIKAPCAWDRENWQKNQVLRGLTDCQKDDLVLFSDVDEIPPHNIIKDLVEEIQTNPVIIIRHHMYRHFLNRDCGDGSSGSGSWLGTLAIRGSMLELPHLNQVRWTPNHLRSNILFDGGWREIFQLKWYEGRSQEIANWNWPNQESLPIWDGGWHFTSHGGFERFYDKCQNWCHFENPHPRTTEAWRAEVDGHRLVPIDETYPQYVQDNIQYFIDVGLIDVPNSK